MYSQLREILMCIRPVKGDIVYDKPHPSDDGKATYLWIQGVYFPIESNDFYIKPPLRYLNTLNLPP